MDISRSTLKIFVARFIGSILSFIGLTYFARKLGASEIGIFFLFQAVLGVLGIPATFGILGGVEKRISEGHNASSILSTSILLIIFPISIVSAFILVFQDHLNAYIGGKVAIYLIITLYFQKLGQLIMNVLNGELRVGDTAIIRLSRKVVWVGTGGIFLLVGYGYLGLIYSVILSFFSVCILSWIRKSVPLGRPSIESVYSIFDYSKYSFISSIGGYFYSWMDVAIIGVFLSQAHVGAYEMAWRITSIVMLLSSSIAIAIFPQISNWDSKNAYGKIEQLLPKAISPTLFLVIPAFFGTVLLSREILGLVFGDEYTIAWLVLIILMAEKLLQSVHVILGRSLQAIDRPDLAAKSGIISMGINLVLNIILIWHIGIVGAAIATALSFALNSILHAHYLSLFITIRFEKRKILWSTASATGMALLVGVMKQYYGIQTIADLLFTILSAIILYTILLLLSNQIRNDIMGRIRQLVPRNLLSH